MIFREATVKHLGMARILVFSILLIDLLVDNLPAMASMPAEAYLPRGVFELVPQAWLPAMFQESTLAAFSWIYGLLLVMGLVGLGPAWAVTGLTLVGTTFFHGVARGFGGHVNHQELITLHACFFLLSGQAYARLSLNSLLWKRLTDKADDDVSRLLLRGLCFWIFLTYFFIGMARIQTGDWRLYGTNAMTFYAVQHSLKWNYWEFSMAKDILHQPLLATLLTLSFPLATVLELGAIFAVFFRILVWPVVLSLGLFHLSILLYMNIFFWQNLLLLLLPVLGWWIDRKWLSQAAACEPLTVFYDAGNLSSERLVNKLAKADTGHRLRFAPMDGETAKEKGVPAKKPGSSSIIVVDEGKQLRGADAVLKALTQSPLWSDLAEFLSIAPRFLREICCKFIPLGKAGSSQDVMATMTGMKHKLLP